MFHVVNLCRDSIIFKILLNIADLIINISIFLSIFCVYWCTTLLWYLNFETIGNDKRDYVLWIIELIWIPIYDIQNRYYHKHELNQHK